ncbi:transcriptional regulator, HxlR family [Micromonospora citrea]|uniref:Transcriptional regulator, HxlR family n=1 Tax=Micromonospora citrea TaxID=47855 RepID=A0A1C6UBL8_9ACTN|nr:helix-turn-helix domain-containing protein [Micromonospora citrea]SCL51378.1 transcriptional regulator, HxlR family [Micromonospora citrea]
MAQHPDQIYDYTSDCRARVAFEVLGNRWDSVVIFTLGAYGPTRPAVLLTRIGGISPKALNDALRRLERNGLVRRRRYREAPPRVDYALTEAGGALLEPMRAMGAWASTWADAVLAAQQRFEARPEPLRDGRGGRSGVRGRPAGH